MAKWIQIKKANNAEPRPHFCTEASGANCAPGNRLCACPPYVSALWTRPYKAVPGVLLQPIGLRLSPSNWSCAVLTNQNGSVLTNQGPGMGTSVSVSRLPWGWGGLSHQRLKVGFPRLTAPDKQFPPRRHSTIELFCSSVLSTAILYYC